jgi:hypothetical protein
MVHVCGGAGWGGIVCYHALLFYQEVSEREERARLAFPGGGKESSAYMIKETWHDESASSPAYA